MNRRLIFTVTAGSLCGLLFGNDIGALSSAAPGLRTEFGLSAGALGFAVSAALIGTIAGSVSAGYLADLLDRRAALLLADLLYLCAEIGASLARGVASFAACRILCGVAIGMVSVVAPMYLAEVAPANRRGMLVGSFQFSLSLGVVLAFCHGYLFSLYAPPELLWRYALATGAAPAALGLIFLRCAMPSPRALALKGDFEQARRVFAALGSANPAADEASLRASMQQFQGAETRLFSRQYLRPILLGVSVAAFNQLTGVNALLYYILDLFRDLGAGHLNGRKEAILVSTLSLVVTLVSVTVIDRVGRKPLLLAGTVGMGLCLMLFPIIQWQHWPAATVVAVLAGYDAFFGFSQGVVVWVYLSEIFPMPVRARGQSLGSTVHWVMNALVVGSFPVIAHVLHERIFVFFAVLMLVQFLAVLWFYPETRRARLESLASDLSA